MSLDAVSSCCVDNVEKDHQKATAAVQMGFCDDLERPR